VGKSALKKGFITSQQLEECRKLRASSSPPQPLARVLFSKGYLDDAQLGEILKEYRLTVGEMMPDDSDPGSIEFGEAVVKKGLAKNVDIWEAIEERARREQTGAEDRLGQILVERGTLAITEAQAILESQGKKILKCAECGHQYNVKEYNPSKEYTCLNCGGPLSPPEEVSSLRVQGTAMDSQTVKQSIDDKFVGTEIGGCMVLEKLGEGGMGSVYKARHITLNKVVAVKIMSSALMGEVHRKRFLREARAAAQLEHQNIIQVHDTGVAEGYNYIVMQFIDGESIQKRINKSGKFDQRESLRVIRDAASALGFAHKRHMIHRDIKPDNIMLTSDDIVKVADFGLVKSTEIEKDLTGMSQSMLMGTPHYMSPEQFEGKIIDHRTDIYSLGVTLYYMLTGQKPYDGTTPYQIMQGHLQQEFVDPSNLSDDIYPAVSQLVRKMMARDREQRYQTCDDIISDINKILAGFDDGTVSAEDFLIVEDDLGPTIQAAAVPEVVGRKEPPKKAEEAEKKMSPLVIVVPALLVVVVVGIVLALILSGGKPEENGKPPITDNPDVTPKEIDPKAQAAFELRKEEANGLMDQNLFFDAIAKWDGFAETWGDDPWKPKVATEREILVQKIIAKVGQLQDKTMDGAELEQLIAQLNKVQEKEPNEELAALAGVLNEKLTGMETAEQTLDRMLKDFQEADERAQKLKNEGKLEEARKIYDPKYTASEIGQIREQADKRVAEIDSLLASLDKQRSDYDKAKKEAQNLAASDKYKEAIDKLQPFTDQKKYIEEIREDAAREIAVIDEASRKHQDDQFNLALQSAQRDFDSANYAEALKTIEPYRNHPNREYADAVAQMEKKIVSYQDFRKDMNAVDDLRNKSEYGRALEIARSYEKSENRDFSTAASLKVMQIRRERYLGNELQFIDGGQIPIGSEDPRDGNPRKTADIRPFYMDRTEVTNAQYEEFVKATRHTPPRNWPGGNPPKGKENHPVTWVSCEDAQAYCEWRSKKDGATYRLPSESEWEYAASYDPEAKKKSTYPWGDEFDSSFANLNGSGTKPVESYKKDKSPLGVFDLAGNVAEWTTSDDGKSCVVRGGSMTDTNAAQAARVSFRHQTNITKGAAGIGFRCVREEN
jgi:tRNA A-37 threonylcarbamoyl transferase component Bud32